jgi:hypothetical protein
MMIPKSKSPEPIAKRMVGGAKKEASSVGIMPARAPRKMIPKKQHTNPAPRVTKWPGFDSPVISNVRREVV